MNYLSKTNAYAASVTTFAMFMGIICLAPAFSESGGIFIFFSAFAATLMAYGIYGALLRLLSFVFAKSMLIRKRILGDQFIEGTWIGSYKNGADRFYTIEFYRLVDGCYHITGFELTQDGEVRTRWNSETVTINAGSLELHYLYRCDKNSAQGEHSGLGRFQLSHLKEGHPPERMDGYSIDSIDGEKDPNTEIKIRDDIISIEEAYKECVSSFQDKEVPQKG